MSQVKHHSGEPLLRLAKRDGISRTKAYTIRVIAVLLSLIVSGIFIFGVTKLVISQACMTVVIEHKSPHSSEVSVIINKSEKLHYFFCKSYSVF